MVDWLLLRTATITIAWLGLNPVKSYSPVACLPFKA